MVLFFFFLEDMFSKYACYSDSDWLPKELSLVPFQLGRRFHSFHLFKDVMVQNKDTRVEPDPNLI